MFAKLFEIIFPPRTDEQMLHAVALDDFLLLLAPCTVPVTRPASVMLLPFHNQHVRAAIHESKYHGTLRAQRLLGIALAEYFMGNDDIPCTMTLIPIPLGNVRERERGFNQVEAIITTALRELPEKERSRFILEPHLLVRTRETASQVTLPRHLREENMRGAFGTTHPANPNQTYFIIDDVLTTGATLQAAIDALKTAGAKHIIPLALAH